MYSIGIDGFEPSLFYRYIRHYNSKGFRDIYDYSYIYKLLSTDPPMSPPAWSSIISGLNVSKHGVYDFYSYNKYSGKLKLIKRDDIPLTIFDIMNNLGLKQLLVNIPFFYPPKAINGIVISGLPAPTGSIYTYPKELGKKLDKNELAVSEPPWTIKKEILKKSIVDRSIFLNRFLEENSWDFTMAVYRETDIAQHFYWENKSYLCSIYGLIDRNVLLPIVEKIKDNREDAVILIYGDHGFTKGSGTFHIMNLLYKENLYTFKYSYRNVIKTKITEFIERIYLSRLTPYVIETFQNYYLSGLMEHFNGMISSFGPLNAVGSVTDGGGYLYLNPKYNGLKRRLYKLLDKIVSKYDVVKDIFELGDGLSNITPDYTISLRDGTVYYPYFTGDEIITRKVPPARKGTHKKDTMLLYIVFKKGEPLTEHKVLPESVNVDDIGTIMLYSSHVYPPNFLDGSIPREIYNLLKEKFRFSFKTLSKKDYIKYRLKLSDYTRYDD